MPYDPQKHHRRSIRLDGYDYRSDGMYFVTICVHDKSCLFGQVRDEKMQLNQYGQIIEEKWLWLAKQYPYVGLDAWVIMGNLSAIDGRDKVCEIELLRESLYKLQVRSLNRILFDH